MKSAISVQLQRGNSDVKNSVKIPTVISERRKYGKEFHMLVFVYTVLCLKLDITPVLSFLRFRRILNDATECNYNSLNSAVWAQNISM
jgi:hypothetical protein